jgi:hypothetical protein
LPLLSLVGTNLRSEVGRACPLCPGISDINLFRYRVPARSDILAPDCDDITATKLAVDRQIENGKVASAAFDLKLRPD